jgi:hypothetical protein
MAKEKQLRNYNRLLSVMVVCLALTSGYLLSDKLGWLRPKPEMNQDLSDTTATISPGSMVSLPSQDKALPPVLSKIFNKNMLHHTFVDEGINLNQASAILWAAQGAISKWGDRTAPSYRSAFPIEVYTLIRKVDGAKPGVYRYVTDIHGLEPVTATVSGNLHFINEPGSLEKAPMVLVLTTQSNQPNALIEAGQIAENILLTANNMDLGSTMLQTFEKSWNDAVGLPSSKRLIILMPIGITYNTQVGAVTAKPTINK